MKLASAALVALACGCGGGPKTAKQVSPEQTDVSKVTNMHQHYDDINAIQLAIISGNLVSVRDLAAKARAGFLGEQPVGWAPFIERSLASMEMLEVTEDLPMAARLAGTMAGTCGDCHRDQGIEVVDHEAVAPPREDDPFSDFMIQHRWAADRMWEGIIGPSDSAWQAGAQALATTSLTKEDVGIRLELTQEIETILLQIREDAAAASSTEGAKERQELYGRFLAGCASCHRDMMNQRD